MEGAVVNVTVHVHVDHIVMAVADLSDAAVRVHKLLGAEVTPGGRHDGIGTENAIVPLGQTYLELVCVVDADAAVKSPFGRLILRSPSVFAGWAALAPEPFAEGSNISREALSRKNVSVELAGLDETDGRSDRPFLLRRPTDQVVPGSDRRSAGRLVSMLVARPSGSGWPPVPRGDTAVQFVRDSSSQGALLAVSIQTPSGHTVTIDDANWSSSTGDAGR
jgi:hypothetical protein